MTDKKKKKKISLKGFLKGVESVVFGSSDSNKNRGYDKKSTTGLLIVLVVLFFIKVILSFLM